MKKQTENLENLVFYRLRPKKKNETIERCRNLKKMELASRVDDEYSFVYNIFNFSIQKLV